MPETLLNLCRWAAGHFTSHNVSEPRASAELLLGHVLGLDRLSLHLNPQRSVETSELASFMRCVERRLLGEPVQYITGTQQFWSLSLSVTPAVLIPRPETELLVEAVLHIARGAGGEKLRIADVGTGSGAIAVALARELPEAVLVAGDLSPVALRVATGNAFRHQVADRVHFVGADLFAPFSRAVFDVVVTNPPYVKSSDIPFLPREIRDYEPRAALDGGVDGLASIRAIIHGAPDVLRSAGVLVLEMGAGQAENVAALVSEMKRYRVHRILKDYSGIDRVLVAEAR
ncbi:MAG TPA: peptide chain release factor N(5)-glutamine methyltransferase [Syntrophobacteria bacterium]|nr:peptide chain release factor N(5)-glutamine methyltransferase [Syntrophobacteria bacterium]